MMARNIHSQGKIMEEQNWGDQELWIVTAGKPETPQTSTGQKTVRRDLNPYTTPSKTSEVGEEIQESRIKAATLATQMSNFVGVLGKVFAQVEQQIKPQVGLQLDEITLSVEISGEGEVKLWGTGVKTGGKGAIELKFKRVDLSK